MRTHPIGSANSNTAVEAAALCLFPRVVLAIDPTMMEPNAIANITGQPATPLARGDELWVLATIPRKGPPRPIALGIKKAGETNIQKLDLN